MNFDYLKSINGLDTLYRLCSNAECYLNSDPTMSAINSRKALELTVRAIYRVQQVEYDEHADLLQLMTDDTFVDFIDNDDALKKGAHHVRKIGNNAAHTNGGEVKGRDAFFSLLNLYNLVGSVLMKMGAIDMFDRFDKTKIPQTAPLTLAAAPTVEPSDTFVNSVDRTQVASRKIQHLTADPSEADTRRMYIDLMLEEAGWTVETENGRIVAGHACIEIPIDGMPNNADEGWADYVLFGNNGLPLAVIEAKRITRSEMEGKHQATLYADGLERRYGVRPVIYCSNGYKTIVIDGLGYPQREVMGFHTMAELQRIMQQRGHRDHIAIRKPQQGIIDRDYQHRAIERVCNHLEQKNRTALIVMATGTGKTRVSIALTDVLMRSEWVQNILFLADRTTLVRQAQRAYSKLLPNTTTCILNEDGLNGDKDARLVFCTYQTMVRRIDSDNRDFTIGRFDLIIIDEAHRSVFGKYGVIFDYFDSMVVGLTATPRNEVDRSTYDFLGLETATFEYSYDDALRDHYLVPFRQWNRSTDVMSEGIIYDNLTDDEKQQLEKVWRYERDRRAIEGDDTGEDGPRDIAANEIFTYIHNTTTIDLVLQDLMENGLKVQGGDRIGKTIIFAYRHDHAELIVKRFVHLYPQYGPDFCVLVDNTVEYAQSLIDRFGQRDREPQITVSVDMLDTGVDVPDVVNLVFFKPVRSKIKFWQMIGRGTRLSKDLFGPGDDKREFYIFDWFDNFAFFKNNDNGLETAVMPSLSARLYSLKCELASLLQSAEHQSIDEERQLHDRLKAELRQAVVQLDDKFISVRRHWKTVEHYRKEEHWQLLKADDLDKLRDEVAPLVAVQQDDEAAKRFDLLMLTAEVASINGNKATAMRCRRQINTLVARFNDMAALPQVRAHQDTINRVLSAGFWERASTCMLEQVREELRELMNLLFTEHRRDFTISIGDNTHYLDEVAIDLPYRQRVLDFVLKYGNNPTIDKIRRLQPLDKQDFEDLERILWKELGTQAEYEQATQRMMFGNYVAAFVRTLTGIDRDEAMRRFSEISNGAILNDQQKAFLKAIIDYVCQNGDITPDTIIKNPNLSRQVFAMGDKARFVRPYIDYIHNVIKGTGTDGIVSEYDMTDDSGAYRNVAEEQEEYLRLNPDKD